MSAAPLHRAAPSAPGGWRSFPDGSLMWSSVTVAGHRSPWHRVSLAGARDWAAPGFCLFPSWGGQAQQPWALIQHLKPLMDLKEQKFLDFKHIWVLRILWCHSPLLTWAVKGCSGRAGSGPWTQLRADGSSFTQPWLGSAPHWFFLQCCHSGEN